MAGEARITYGLGYSLNADQLSGGRESYEEVELDYLPYFDRDQLTLIDPFHGSESGAFAVLARSTVRSGDPQEWDQGYGIQGIDLRITAEESAALLELREGLRRDFPELMEGGKALSFVLSITADM